MRRLFMLGLLLIAANVAVMSDEETPPDSVQRETPKPARDNAAAPNRFSRFKERAVLLEINVRVVDQNQPDQDLAVIWNESHTEVTIPGRPVAIKLVGTNLVITAQFTPYIRHRTQKFLVAQGQIWMNVPGQGIRYHTSMQTIPLEFGEPIYFFPLGSVADNTSASIEIMLTMNPYEER